MIRFAIIYLYFILKLLSARQRACASNFELSFYFLHRGDAILLLATIFGTRVPDRKTHCSRCSYLRTNLTERSKEDVAEAKSRNTAEDR